MKLIFTLFVLFNIATKIPAQKISTEARIALAVDMIAAPQKDVKIKTGCTTWAGNKYVRPLLVIDGIPDESAELQKLDAGNIVSIDILKEAALATLYGNHPRRTVFIITTRSVYTKKFIIKDFSDSRIIPQASILFISRDSRINCTADKAGIISTDKLIRGEQYEMRVTSAGYKPQSLSFNNNLSETRELFLERDVHEEVEIIISSPYKRRRGCPANSPNQPPVSKAIKIEMTKEIASKPIYPNPVQRNSSFNFEFENTQDETMQLAIISMSGNIVSLQPKKITKGFNHLSIIADARWSAGIYNIQIRNEKGTLVRQQKLVVQ